MPRNEGYTFVRQVDAKAAGLTLVQYLALHFNHSTSQDWQQRLQRGEVLLNQRVADSTASLSAGDTIAWNRPGWEEDQVPRDVQWIHADDDLVIVSKPSGLPTLPGAGFLNNTLLSLVQSRFPDANPLHRLGRATSGLVVFARNKPAAAALSAQWPEVDKFYWAHAQGTPPHNDYRIDTPIGKSASGEHPRLDGVYCARPDGKQALSLARVVNRLESTCVFQVQLVTGRPHQIRIHLASIGHPLVGDPMYAPGGGFLKNPGLPGDPGYCLHAWKIVFQHPTSHEQLEFTCPPPTVATPS